MSLAAEHWIERHVRGLETEVENAEIDVARRAWRRAEKKRRKETR